MAVTLAVNDTNWFFSPYNWIVTGSTSAQTNNAGAYFKLGFTGTSASLSFDTSALTGASVPAGSYPIIIFSVDNGPWQSVQTSSGGTVSLASGLAAGAHQIWCVLKSVDINYDRWNTPIESLKITGCVIDTAASSAPPTLNGSRRMLIYGDSITEGERATGILMPGSSDASTVYGHALGLALGCEYGIVGFGGQGWVAGGAGNVPIFGTAWSSYWNGQSRLSGGLLTPAPSYVFCCQGTNDGLQALSAATVTANAAAWLTNVRAAAGLSALVGLIVPFGGYMQAALVAAMASYQAAPDARAVVLDISTIPGTNLGISSPANLYSTDGTHLNAWGQSVVAADLAALWGGILARTPNAFRKALITTATTAVVKPTAGILWSLACTVATATQVTIYDNASAASGQKLYDGVPPAGGQSVGLWIPATNGITVVTTGTATVEITYS